MLDKWLPIFVHSTKRPRRLYWGKKLQQVSWPIFFWEVEMVGRVCLLLVVSVVLLFRCAFAYDVTEKFTVDATLSLVYQKVSLDDQEAQSIGVEDSVGRGSGTMDLGFNFHPTDVDEFQVTLSFGAGNGLKYTPIFSLATNADDLESDLKNINGRDRDYLLEVWYKHTFKLKEDLSISGTIGIIDATQYLDQNPYANDETAQFMNEVFVNNPVLNLPSYDLGGVLELSFSDLSVKALAMGSRTEDWQAPGAYRGYGYYGLELGYKLKDPLGEGNISLLGYTTTKDFVDWQGVKGEALKGFGLSFGHPITEYLGVFLRGGWQDDKAQITHQKSYSGGIDISGKLWGREDDNIGVGYAYLKGPDQGLLDCTHAIEGYAKFKITNFSHLTFDVQYLKDKFNDNTKLDGMVYGVRFVVKF